METGDRLKACHTDTVKFVKLTADLAQKLSLVYEQSSNQVLMIVEAYRKRSQEFKNGLDILPFTNIWEIWLNSLDADAKDKLNLSNYLSDIFRESILKTVIKKNKQYKQCLSFKEHIDSLLSKQEDGLQKAQKEYEKIYQDVKNKSDENSIKNFVMAHNNYVCALNASNSLEEAYHQKILPYTYKEFEVINTFMLDKLYSTLSENFTLTMSKTREKVSRYEKGSLELVKYKKESDVVHSNLILPKAETTPPKFKFTTPQEHFSIVNQDCVDNVTVYLPSLETQLQSKIDGLVNEKMTLESTLSYTSEFLNCLISYNKMKGEDRFDPNDDDISKKRRDILLGEFQMAGIDRQIEMLSYHKPIKTSGVRGSLPSTTNGQQSKCTPTPTHHPTDDDISHPSITFGDDCLASAHPDPQDPWLISSKSSYNRANKAHHSNAPTKTLTQYPDQISSTTPLATRRSQFASREAKKGPMAPPVTAGGGGGGVSRTATIKTKWKSALKAIKKSLQTNDFTKIPSTSSQFNHSNGSGGPGNAKQNTNNLKEHQESTTVAPGSKPLIKMNSVYDKQEFLATLDNHQFQEVSFKKPIPCNYCREIMRGLNQQGLRCKGCKINVHDKCKDKVGICSRRLINMEKLRKQRSQSDIDTKNIIIFPRLEPAIEEAEVEMDPVYQLLKNASNFRKQPNPTTNQLDTVTTNVAVGKGVGGGSRESLNKKKYSLAQSEVDDTLASHVGTLRLGIKDDFTQQPRSNSENLDVMSPPQSISAPHSPTRKKKKFNLRMKSFSLDTPDNSNPNVNNLINPKNIPPTLSECGSVSSAINVNDEMGDNLGDLNQVKPDFSLNSIYLVTRDYHPKKNEEAKLSTGTLVKVIRKNGEDWYEVEIDVDKVQYVPAKCLWKVEDKEQLLQVLQNLQLNEKNHKIFLTKDQIVVKVKENDDGMMNIMAGSREIQCPAKYLRKY